MVRVAADILTDPPPPPAGARIAYGHEPLQFGDLRRADSDALAIVLHGGAWKATYNLIHTGHLCVALRDAGIGWPGSLEDVLRAIEHARTLADRLVLVGHSAGGHLALLAAARVQLPVVAIAAVCDPATWDHPAVPLLLGDERPREASPLAQLPLGAPTILVHGTADEVVPFEQSVRYAGQAGSEAELVALEGAGHFEPIDPLSPEWTAVRDAIRRLAGVSSD